MKQFHNLIQLSKTRPIAIWAGKQLIRVVLSDGTLLNYTVSGNSRRNTPLEWTGASIDNSIAAAYLAKSASCSSACFSDNGSFLLLGLESPSRLIALRNRLESRDGNDETISLQSPFVPRSKSAIGLASAAIAFADQPERKSRFIDVNQALSMICVVYARSFAVFDFHHEPASKVNDSAPAAIRLELRFQRAIDDWKAIFARWHPHVSNTLLIVMERDRMLRMVEWKVDQELLETKRFEIGIPVHVASIAPDLAWQKLLVACKDSTFLTIEVSGDPIFESNRMVISGHSEPVLVTW
jgi:hypothetical protein